MYCDYCYEERDTEAGDGIISCVVCGHGLELRTEHNIYDADIERTTMTQGITRGTLSLTVICANCEADEVIPLTWDDDTIEHVLEREGFALSLPDGVLCDDCKQAETEAEEAAWAAKGESAA